MDKLEEIDFSKYNVLVTAHNTLKLEPIIKHNPKSDFSEQELSDTVHKISVNLKDFYEVIAIAEPKFRPYWNQEKTFTQAVDELPKTKGMRFFESYKHFFKKNDLEKIVELDKHLNLFHGFGRPMEFYGEPLYWRSRKNVPSTEKIKEEMSMDRNVTNFFKSAFLVSFCAGNSLMIYGFDKKMFGVGLGGATMAGVSYFFHDFLKMAEYHTQETFEKYTTDILNRKTATADNAIKMIHELAG